MVSSPLAVPAVTISIVPEHGGSGVNRLKNVVLVDACLRSLRLSNAYRGGGHDQGSVASGVACVVVHPPSGDGTGSAAERTGPIRFLRSVPVLVAILLRWRCRARRPQRQCAVRAATLFFRRSWAVADAGAAADFQRMGPPRHLFRPIATRLLREW